MHKLISMVLLSITLVAGAISYAVSETSRSSAVMEQNIKTNMDAHIEKVKRKNPARYHAMMEGANNTITGCLSCHIDLADNKKNKTRKHSLQ